MTAARRAPIFERLAREEQVRLMGELRERNAIVHYRTGHGLSGGRETIDGRECVMLASNDYLGLRWDERVIEAAQQAMRFGSGSGGSRLMAGNTALHHVLEAELAEWLGREQALLFTTGYQANLGTLSSLLRPQETVLCEADIHASLVDGCRLAGARIRRFGRRDLETMTRQLARSPVAVVVDSVYSMDGDVLDLAGVLARLPDEVPLLLDEAHALGVIGPMGSGVAATVGGGRGVDLVTGTLSKSLASCGGFVAGPAAVIDPLRVKARSLIFSTASVPAALGAALAALRILRAEPEHRERVVKLATMLRDGLRSVGVDVGRPGAAIIPVRVGDNEAAIQVAAELFDRGICAGVALHPAVPKGGALLRFGVTARLTDSDLDRTIAETLRALKRHGVLD